MCVTRKTLYVLRGGSSPGNFGHFVLLHFDVRMMYDDASFDERRGRRPRIDPVLCVRAQRGISPCRARARLARHGRHL